MPDDSNMGCCIPGDQLLLPAVSAYVHQCGVNNSVTGLLAAHGWCASAQQLVIVSVEGMREGWTAVYNFDTVHDLGKGSTRFWLCPGCACKVLHSTHMQSIPAGGFLNPGTPGYDSATVWDIHSQYHGWLHSILLSGSIAVFTISCHSENRNTCKPMASCSPPNHPQHNVKSAQAHTLPPAQVVWAPSHPRKLALSTPRQLLWHSDAVWLRLHGRTVRNRDLCVATALAPRHSLAHHGEHDVGNHQQAHDNGNRRDPRRIAQLVGRAAVPDVHAHVHRCPRRQDRDAAEVVVHHVPRRPQLGVVRRRAHKRDDDLQAREPHDNGAQHLVAFADRAARDGQPAARQELPRIRKRHDEQHHARQLAAHVDPEPHLLAACIGVGSWQPPVARHERAQRQQEHPCDRHQRRVHVQLLPLVRLLNERRAARAQADAQRAVGTVLHAERILAR
eukprot:363364-Chlamydomonas_euryale.AAC.4